MKKNLAIFYHNLKNKGNDIPYVSTLAFFVLSIVLHWFQTVIIFDVPRWVYSPIQLGNATSNRWVNSLIFLTPIFIAFLLLFEKSSLEDYKLTELDLRNGYQKHCIYIISSIALLIGLLIRDGLKKGHL